LISKQVSEHGMEEAQTLLQAVLNSSPHAIVSTDAEGAIRTFNAGAERIFGHDRAYIQGQSIDLLMPARFRARHRSYLQQFAAAGATLDPIHLGPFKGVCADGQEIDLDATLTKVWVQSQPVLISHLCDATDRLKAEAEFKHVQAQLCAVTSKLQTLEKTLVKRLSQALHDQLGQTLAAIRMTHEAMVTLQGDPTPAAVVQLRSQMDQHISLAIRQARQVLVDLRPPLLDEQGLAAALNHALSNRTLSCPHLDLALLVQPELSHKRYPTEVEYAAFMVMREALDNALKHAKATAISVRLSGTPQAIHLVVSDNGTGLTLDSGPPPGHFGILGMHERALAVGALVSFGAVSPTGTCVEFVWPPTHAGVPL
jgi:PAS domain S-box-containing protein